MRFAGGKIAEIRDGRISTRSPNYAFLAGESAMLE
jgi:hypothetical protein